MREVVSGLLHEASWMKDVARGKLDEGCCMREVV